MCISCSTFGNGCISSNSILAQIFIAGDDQAKTVLKEVLAKCQDKEPVDFRPVGNAKLLEAMAIGVVYLGTVGKKGQDISMEITGV